MLRLIFNLFEKKFISHLHRKNGTKLTKDNMVFSFHDLEGNAYYSFPKELSIPIVRFGKIQEFYTWLSAGMTGEEIEKLIDSADKALTGLVNGDKKGFAKTGFILHEMKERKKMIIHPELYYNIIAAQLVRHDENVNEWNQDIQLQKVEQFKRMDAEGDYFFLATNELLKQLTSLDITRNQLQTMLRESAIQIKSMDLMMQNL
jgi:hypothetical protein